MQLLLERKSHNVSVGEGVELEVKSVTSLGELIKDLQRAQELGAEVVHVTADYDDCVHLDPRKVVMETEEAFKVRRAEYEDRESKRRKVQVEYLRSRANLLEAQLNKKLNIKRTP